MFHDKRPIFDSEIQIKAMSFVEIQRKFDMFNSSEFENPQKNVNLANYK